jgi:amino acid adenylation domain-containing protein
MSNLSTTRIEISGNGSSVAGTGVCSTDDRRLVTEWNRTEASYPSHACLHQLFEEQSSRTPDALAVIQGQRRLSYRELNAKANQLARYLRSSGVSLEDPVAVCLRPSIEFAISILAILKAGGACVPLDPSYPKQRLAFMLEDVKARVLLTVPELLSEIGPVSTPSIDLNSAWPYIEQQSRENLQDVVGPENLAYIIYTSGSTGTPKGVLLGHRGLVNHSALAIKLYGLRPDERMLQFSSISFDIAIEELYPTWSSGGAVVLKDANFSLGFAELMEFVRKYEITALDLPTAYWHEWTNFLFDNRQLPPRSLRLVIVGGEKVSAAILARWQSRVGKSIRWVNTYGPSEASVIATAYEPAETDELPQVPIGRPVANTKIYLLDRSMDLVAVGEAGELYIGGLGVARGYLNRPELSAEKFVPDPFSSDPNARLYRTGDMARYRTDGEIEFLGREDDQVKIRGFRVEPGEIEDVLSRHASVREAAVVAKSSESGEKRLIAYIVCAKETAVSDGELREYLKNQLPDYMVPSVFVMLDAMPTTPNGKVDRRSLPEPKAEAIPQPSNGSDPLQGQVARIWQEVLGRSVGVQDNFFEVGGHSLLAAKLMHRIGQTVGKTLPLAMLLEAPTIEQLSVALGHNGWSRHWCSLVPIQTRGSRAPFFCIHGVGGNVVGFRDLGAHMGPTHPFYGLQARGLDGQHENPVSIEEMAAHYLGEIRTVQPKGPYLLGGFSFGGLVAYEMSRQLRAQDEEVALLALFDTYPGNLKPMGSSLLKSLKSPVRLMIEIPRFARRRARLFWRRITVPKALREVFRANSRAANKYVLQTYSGKVTLFRASEKSLRSDDDPHAAWSDLVKGGLEFQDVPGDHYGILVEPEVTFLSEKLKACIDQALGAQTLAVQGSPAETV